jgi:hypothetical protein
MFRARFLGGGSSPRTRAALKPVKTEHPADRNGMRIKEYSALNTDTVKGRRPEDGLLDYYARTGDVMWDGLKSE